jgi:hypothetical protein
MGIRSGIEVHQRGKSLVHAGALGRCLTPPRSKNASSYVHQGRRLTRHELKEKRKKHRELNLFDSHGHENSYSEAGLVILSVPAPHLVGDPISTNTLLEELFAPLRMPFRTAPVERVCVIRKMLQLSV